jgi:hypothetical protein
VEKDANTAGTTSYRAGKSFRYDREYRLRTKLCSENKDLIISEKVSAFEVKVLLQCALRRGALLFQLAEDRRR